MVLTLLEQKDYIKKYMGISNGAKITAMLTRYWQNVFIEKNRNNQGYGHLKTKPASDIIEKAKMIFKV